MNRIAGLGILGLSFALGVFAAETPLAEEKTQPVKTEEPKADERDRTMWIFVLKDGTREKGTKYVDFGDVYSVKDPAGNFKTLKKEDVARVLDPIEPPAREAVVRVPPEPEKKSPSTPAEPKHTEANPPAVARREPPRQPDAQPTPKPKGPAGTWTLKDGRVYHANQAIEAGDDWLLQTVDGRMVRFKKSDVKQVER